jgi:alkylation response protein AidB-like acyl-CoA dehydrogenase
MNDLDLKHFTARASTYDQTSDWPAEDLADLARLGAMRWAIQREFGGEDLPAIDLHLHYESIAAASLTTALILTQRDSAAAFLEASENRPLREELLPRLARNEIFTTVGIAQLTTSRQGGTPVLQARRDGDAWIINGLIPWSTGPDQSQFIVAGAALAEDPSQQILFALPSDLPGITIQPPMPLVALRASHTTSITCKDVRLEARWLLRGPAAGVLGARKKSLPLSQTFLALGLCRGGIQLIAEHRSDLARDTAAAFTDQLQTVRHQIVHQCTAAKPCDADTASNLRGGCNDLALRITHAAVAIYKGTALLADHPAQRLAREAMFLLVWSCPAPVIDCMVRVLRDRQINSTK